jgi:hypothetical protein
MEERDEVERVVGRLKGESPRRFYKTVFQFTVLSEDPLPDMPMETLVHGAESGDFLGDWALLEEREMGGAEAAQALIDYNSEPEFFGLDEKGRDLE